MTRKEREARLKVLRPKESEGSAWDRWAAQVARDNKRVESEDIATASFVAFLVVLAAAIVLHIFHVL